MYADPSKDLQLSTNVALNIIDQVYEIPSVKVVVLTGGEPTLHRGLKEIIKYAYNQGFTVRLVTNAWWAYSEKEAYRFVDELASSGLKEINISYDDFHLEYIPEKYILNAIKASCDYGLRTIIGIIRHKYSRVTGVYVKSKLRELSLHSKAYLLEDVVTPLGRGSTLPKDVLLERRDALDVPCTDIGSTLTVLPDGSVMACCGHLIAMEEGRDLFLLGNVYNSDIKQLLAKLRRNVLYWFLFLKPFRKLLELLQLDPGGISVYGRCYVCYLVYKLRRDKLMELARRKNELLKYLKEY